MIRGNTTSQHPAGERLLSKDFALVCLGSFAVFTSFYFLLPTLPLYVKGLGGQDAEVGLIIGVFTVSAVITRLLVGRALDLWGRKWLYVTGALLFLVAVLLYSLTTSVPSLLLLRLFHGVGFGMGTTAGSTLIADLAPLRRRAEAMGYFGNFSNIAMALSPGAGLWLIGATGLPMSGFPLVFASSAAFAGLALVLALLVRETRRVELTQTSATRRPGIAGLFNKDALPTAIAILFFSFSYGAVISFLPLYAGEENGQNVAVFFFAYSLVVLVSRPIMGALSDRVGRRKVVIPSMVLSALGVGMLALAPSLPVMLGTAIVYGVGFGALYPSMLALAVDIVQPQERGAALGTFLGAFDTGIALGSVLCGLVAQTAGYGTAFLLAGVVGVVGLVYFVAYPRFVRPPEPARTTTQP